jgi:hypothetical protein
MQEDLAKNFISDVFFFRNEEKIAFGFVKSK